MGSLFVLCVRRHFCVCVVFARSAFSHGPWKPVSVILFSVVEPASGFGRFLLRFSFFFRALCAKLWGRDF